MTRSLIDHEFGEIRVKRIHSAQHVRLRIGGDGQMIATLPKRAALRLVSDLVDSSRDELRRLLMSHPIVQKKIYENDQRIGASHTLKIYPSSEQAIKSRVIGQDIVIKLPKFMEHDSDEVQAKIKKAVSSALKKEASAYLPRRLRYLADMHGFIYETTRFSNPKGRWGSCSSSGTISLNIALMTLPMDIIDYVLLHELAHTREMNHSPRFWTLVEQISPNYQILRKQLKLYNPYL